MNTHRAFIKAKNNYLEILKFIVFVPNPYIGGIYILVG